MHFISVSALFGVSRSRQQTQRNSALPRFALWRQHGGPSTMGCGTLAFRLLVIAGACVAHDERLVWSCSHRATQACCRRCTAVLAVAARASRLQAAGPCCGWDSSPCKAPVSCPRKSEIINPHKICWH